MSATAGGSDRTRLHCVRRQNRVSQARPRLAAAAFPNSRPSRNSPGLLTGARRRGNAARRNQGVGRQPLARSTLRMATAAPSFPPPGSGAAPVRPFLSHPIRGGSPRLRSVPSSFLLVEKQVRAVGEDFVDFVVGEAGTALEGVDFVLRVHDGVVGAEDEAVSGVLFQNGPEHVVGDFLHA